MRIIVSSDEMIAMESSLPSVYLYIDGFDFSHNAEDAKFLCRHFSLQSAELEFIKGISDIGSTSTVYFYVTS